MSRRAHAWKARALALRRELRALALASRHPDVPRRAKLAVGAVVAYALSPIDLIPDFIPVLGYVDDLVLIPLGIAWAIKMIPPDVMDRCRAESMAADRPAKDWRGAAIVIAVWAIVLGAVCWWVWHRLAVPSG